MKTRNYLYAGCAAMLAAGGAFAQTYYWDAPVNGLYTDGTKWNSNVAPGTAEKGFFDKPGPYTVTFPQDFTNDQSRTEVSVQGKITFDTQGTSWVKPTSPGNILPTDDTFKINGPNGHSFNLEGTGNGLMQFGLFDAVLTAEGTPDAIHTTLESGLLNTYDATGVDDSGTCLIVAHNDVNRHYVTFKEGSASRIRKIDFRANGPENVWRVEGGDHTVFDTFNVLCWNSSGQTAKVECVDGRLDVRNYFDLGQRGNTTGILLVDGGEVCARHLRFAADGGGRATGIISNGSLTVDYLQVGQAGGSEADIVMTGGSVTASNEVSIGGDGTGSMEFSGGRWDSNGGLWIARGYWSRGRLTLSGGSFNVNNGWLGVTGGGMAESELLVTGGGHYINSIVVAPDGGKGFAELAGGNVDTREMITGWNDVSTNSEMVISGGQHITRDLLVGRDGLGYFEMSGGVLDCYGYIRTGTGYAQYDGYDPADTNRISTLRITGGTLRVWNNYPVNVTDGGHNATRLVLDGGTLAARFIRGWNGSACKGGEGYSELTADGGRVVPLPDSFYETFMETFDLALLGDAGLTVDTAGTYGRITQAFEPKPGTRGRLIKAGIGTLYLDGQSTIGDLDVIGGTLAAMSDNIFTGHLTVTNGATLSLTESGVTGLTLEALTLGDASSTGRLRMDNTDTIAITTPSGLNIVNGRILLSSPSADGTYTFFRCVGTVTPQDLEGLDISNGAVTKDYIWSVVQGTNVVLTVADRTPSPSVTWTGNADTDWDKPGNWLSAQPPAKGDKAVFPDNAARKNVSVAPDAIAGELDFLSPAGYALSGQRLLLDNGTRGSLVTAASGDNTIAAPLTLKRITAFDISEGAAVTVSTLQGDGALQKSGTGLVTLNGANTFSGGFRVQEGTLALTSPDAFGTPSHETDRWTLAGGTLRYDGPAASRNHSIAVDVGFAPDDKPAILDTASDLTLNGTPAVTKGVLIKRGAGTLTFNAGGAGNILSAGNGKAGGNQAVPWHPVVFPGNGEPPDGGYSGFNIAEGKVRLTGADATARFDLRNAASIGLQTTQGTASPALEIDHCEAYQGGGSLHFYIGANTPAGSVMTNPALRVVNGSYLWTDTLYFGLDSAGEVNPGFLVDNSRVFVSWVLVTRQPNGGVTAITLTNKADLTVNGDNLSIEREVCFLADDSLLQLNNTGSGTVIFGWDAKGSFTLRNGARMRYPYLRMEANAQMILAFDGGILEPRVTDTVFAFRGDNTRQAVQLTGQGLTFDIADGMTHTLARNMEGDGPLRKAGTGTLVLAGLMEEYVDQGERCYTPLGAPIDDYTGGTWVDAGTLAVSNGAIRADSRITVAHDATLELTGAMAIGTIAGNGTILGGALTQGTLAPGTADGETGSLTLQGTTLSGITFACDVEQEPDKTITASDKLLNIGTASNVIVDFGRTSANPLLTPCSIQIGTYDTTPPDTGTWKVRGIGAGGTTGEIVTDNGIITANVRFSGFILLIR